MAAFRLPMCDRVVAARRRSLTCFLVPRDAAFSLGEPALIEQPTRAAPHGHVLAAHGRLHLAPHATKRDPARRAAVMAGFDAPRLTLQAAILPGGGT